MNWLRKIFSNRDVRENDEFAEEIKRALGGFESRAVEFAKELHEFGVEEQIADLKGRIEALEKAIYPLRNGAPTRT